VDEQLLGDVLGSLLVAHDAERQGVHTARVTVIECLERRSITGTKPGDQFEVARPGRLSLHRAPHTRHPTIPVPLSYVLPWS